MSDFTPNPVGIPEYRDSVRLFTEPHSGTVWHYQGCAHHMRELAKAERAHGWTAPFHVFHAGLGAFCAPCYHFDNQTGGRPDTSPQIPREEAW